MNLFNLIDRGVRLNGGRQKSKPQLAAEEALALWKDDLLMLQLFLWSNFEHEEYPHKALRLTTILTLIGLSVAHRDKVDDTPFILTIREAIAAVENVNEDRSEAAVRISAACHLASEELSSIPWPSVIHAVTYIYKQSHGT